MHFASINVKASNLQTIVKDAERLFALEDPKQPDFKVLTKTKDLKKVLKSLSGPLVIDIETTGLEFSDELIQVGFSDLKTPTCWIFKTLPMLSSFIEEVEKSGRAVVGHNFQFDLSRLVHWAGNTTWYPKVYDTQVRAHVLGEEVLSLKHLTSKYTTRAGSRSFGSIHDEAYVSEDVFSTRDVWAKQEEQMVESQPWILDRLTRLVAVVAHQQQRGVFIDREMLKSQQMQLMGILEAAQSGLTEAFPGSEDVNWNSSAQISKTLEAAGIKLFDKTPTGQWKTDEATLKELQERGEGKIGVILGYRAATKLKAFIESYLGFTSDEDPFLRPRLKLTGTQTGRLSCSDPNLQQVPREGELKSIFRSRWEGGKIGLVDLSQAELRIVALLSEDKALMEALKASDVHLAMAENFYSKPADMISTQERKRSKGFTFGILYGATEQGLSHTLGVDPDIVKRGIKRFFKIYPDLDKWVKITGSAGIVHGEVSTIFGRTRNLERFLQQEGKQSVSRKAVNTPVQSVASDCDLLILGTADTWLREKEKKSRPFIGVHDSILFDIYPGDLKSVTKALRKGFRILNDSPLADIPAWVELDLEGELIIGESWAAVESTNDLYMPEKTILLSSSLKGA